MKHKTEIDGYKTMVELCEEIGNLRYDALADFLSLLDSKLSKDGVADFGRGRLKLGGALIEASEGIRKARDSIRTAWKISAPHMDLKG